jgi:phage terminase large subunit
MEIAVKQTVNEIFAPLWEKKARYYICMGGRGAGRSTAGSQYALSKLIAPEFTRGALMRAVQSDIRHSIWRELVDRAEEQGIKEALHVVDSDLYIKYGDNSFKGHGFKASSGSLTARLKSLANYNIIIIEEAEEIGAEEFRTLDDSLRTVKGDIHIVLLLNPPHKNHWIIEKWFDLDAVDGVPDFYIPKLKEGITDTVFVKGNYLDNILNLDEHTVKRYKDYQRTNPSYYYQMIAGYIPEVVRGKIYKGWELIDELPEEAKLLRIGGDWGWYPDPVATIALYYYDGYYIVDGITYGNEIEDTVIASDIRNIDPEGKIRAVFGADEPKSISLMEDKGINAVKSIFGPGSVDTRIKMTAEKRIKVVRKNHPVYGNWVWDNYEKYHWAEDKDGNPKGEPDHEGSDPMDAISYAIADLVEKDKKGTSVYKPGMSNSKVRINKSSIGYSRFR